METRDKIFVDFREKTNDKHEKQCKYSQNVERIPRLWINVILFWTIRKLSEQV